MEVEMKKWLAILMAVAYAGISHGQDIIDSWSFTVDPDPNASIATSLSTSDIAGGGGATWADNNNSSIEGGEAKFIRAGRRTISRMLFLQWLALQAQRLVSSSVNGISHRLILPIPRC